MNKKSILLTLLCVACLIFIPQIKPALAQKSKQKYEDFRNSYENIVIYETEIDTYVVFPYITYDLAGYAAALSDGSYLTTFIARDDDDNTITRFWYYSADWELIDELTFIAPQLSDAYTITQSRLNIWGRCLIDPSFFVAYYYYGGSDFDNICMPFKIDYETKTISPIVLYLPDGTINHNADVRYDQIYRVDDLIIYTTWDKDFVVLQNEDTVLWSYEKNDPAQRLYFDIATDGELFYIIVYHDEGTDSSRKEFLIVDKTGSAKKCSMVLPKENWFNSRFDLECVDGQLVIYRPAGTANLLPPVYSLFFDVDKENAVWNFTEARRESSPPDPNKELYQWTCLVRTNFLDTFVSEHCHYWKEEGRLKCGDIGVLRISK